MYYMYYLDWIYSIFKGSPDQKKWLQNLNDSKSMSFKFRDLIFSSWSRHGTSWDFENGTTDIDFEN